MKRRLSLLICAAALLSNAPLDAQDISNSLRWRNIGPNRGGRSIAVAGSSTRPLEYYFGATGGGLWKTTDGGTNWAPVTDGQIRSSSVGAVAVAPSNPDVVYLGMGETQLRGNIMQGDGIYKSVDAGKTWKHIGLPESQAIGRIIVHPANADVAYVTALGHPYGRNAERGVYRTRDGGATWQKILYRNDATGGLEITFDPKDPRTLYTTLWDVHRRPWQLWSGGPGSGLFKSTDGGDTWTELTRNPGMPEGVLGKMTVSVSGADSRRVYANIEANAGGLYRSDDAGATWTHVNGHRDLWQRSFYFLRIAADPKDRETIYVLSFGFMKSTDGGKTFVELDAPHVDHHDIWIDPANPARMIDANDGGANVSTDGGRHWTEQDYPTAQIYRVATSFDTPYEACGAQQDNTTVCVASAGRSADDFYAVGGGENAVIAPDPRNPDIFYANETNSLTRFDRRSGLERDVQPYPYMVMGEPARGMRERWNWTYPIVFSPFDSTTLYAGSQHLWRTRDEGRTWQKISGDLTRADTATLGDSGGPIRFDQDGPEIYGTIFTIAPSPHSGDVIWTGSDDGYVQITRDGGRTWQNVTPRDAKPFTRMSRVEVSPHDPATAYVAGNRYQMDDRAPYIWKTADYGRTWTKIVSGIRADDFAHVVREDTKRRGLLFAGTEHGVYVSSDDGASWRSLSLNLPDVQISDMVVKDNDIVIATHGRSFYVLDDIAPLRQWNAEAASARAHLFEPAPAIRRMGPAVIDYHLGSAAKNVTIEILNANRDVVQTLRGGRGGLPNQAGIHRATWDLRYRGSTVFPGIILEGANPAQGPWAPPGLYTVRLTADGVTHTSPLEVKKHPLLTDVTNADLQAQFALAIQIRNRTSDANNAVIRIREIRDTIQKRMSALNAEKAAAARALLDTIAAVEGELYQVRNQGPKDKIAFPIKLNNRLSGLRGNLEKGDAAPSEAYYRVFRELSADLDVQLSRLNHALESADGSLWK